MSKSPITCHVLDASVGRPAAGIAVVLSALSASGSSFSPSVLAEGVTDADGRCTTLLDPAFKPAPGVYRMTFRTGAYFEKMGTETFYPFVEITFNYANPEQHYHIPLLLSPFSYTTYRGS
ncbi:hypothetical protein Q5752_004075 [Cryptotrichosporon argae]